MPDTLSLEPGDIARYMRSVGAPIATIARYLGISPAQVLALLESEAGTSKALERHRVHT